MEDLTVVAHSLLENIYLSIDTFNDLFKEISVIGSSSSYVISSSTSTSSLPDIDSRIENSSPLNERAHSPTTTGNLNGHEHINSIDFYTIDRKVITPAQCNKIDQLSGYMISVRNLAEKLSRIHLHSNKESTNLNHEVELTNLSKLLMEKKVMNDKNVQRISVLQTFLVNELNRSEKAEKDLIDRENDLVSMTDERNKYMKQLQSYQKQVEQLNLLMKTKQAGNQQQRNGFMNSLTKVNDDNTNGNGCNTVYDSDSIHAMIGTFVRKKFGANHFFGLAVSYEKPFYKVWNTST